MRGTGVVSTACDSGVLEEEVLDDELDVPGPCAATAGATTTPPTSNATAAAAAAIGSRRGVIGMVRDREERFKLVSCL
jgi:hypothetical protein